MDSLAGCKTVSQQTLLISSTGTWVLKVLHAHPLLPTAAAGASERMEQVFALMGYLQPLSTHSWQLLDTGHQAS